MSGTREFIGRGWAFPLRLDNTGRVALVSEQAELEESMRLILSTAYGERPMRPEFGCGIHDFVFAGAHGATLAQIEYEVRRSLRRWEPRVNVENVTVTPSDQRRELLSIEIAYSVPVTNDRRNLVFPFYVIPEET